MRRTKEQLAREVVAAVLSELLARESFSEAWSNLTAKEQDDLRSAWVERVWRIV